MRLESVTVVRYTRCQGYFVAGSNSRYVQRKNKRRAIVQLHQVDESKVVERVDILCRFFFQIGLNLRTFSGLRISFGSSGFVDVGHSMKSNSDVSVDGYVFVLNGLISTVHVAFDKPMEFWSVTACSVDFVADVDSFEWVFCG